MYSSSTQPVFKSNLSVIWFVLVLECHRVSWGKEPQDVHSEKETDEEKKKTFATLFVPFSLKVQLLD